MDRITFYVNQEKCSVGSEVDSDTSLNDYIRNHLNLRGTKYMCKEGGCGACVVAVTVNDPHRRTFSVNSCLVSITSCQDWEITTIEGIGNRARGYHPVQKTLAEYNGTQCGYCSAGFVMSMYSLLEANHYDLTQYEIENSFGSNTCRCTGSRPILDAFKSFAKDAPKPPPKIEDIEDLKICQGKGDCKGCHKDKNWCMVSQSDVDPPRIKKINLKDGHVWYRVNEIADIFTVLDAEGYESYMLVNGNTGRGAVPVLVHPRVLIDIQPIKELKGYYLDQNLVVGAGITLTDLMKLFKKVSKAHEEFQYLFKLYEHLDLVAHIPVRNIGTVAGNLMTKYRLNAFSSDIFLLLETIGATLVIVGKGPIMEVTPEQFLSIDMTGRVIAHVKIPPRSHRYQFVSFKIMPRAQNAHAQVNAAFLYEFDEHQKDVVLSARIVIGGLSGKFVHATETEKFLHMKKIFTNEVLQQALKILEGELIVEEIAGEMKPAYRKKCALGLFYKSLLVLIPKQRLKPWYRSGARDFRKTRPLSKGSEVYDTNPIIWPVNEPMPKVDALVQCAGEAQYCNDLPTQPKEVFCAFVTSDIGTGEIESIDATPALKIPGVLAFFSAKDIPGKNSFLSQRVPGQLFPEEVFVEKTIKYYDQPIGVIVAETERLAYRAALLVKVNYKLDKKKPILTIKDAREREPSRVSLFLIYPARDRGLNVQRVLKGTDEIYAQCAYYMESQTSVSRPSEDGIDVYASTQFLDSYHTALSEVLNIPQNRINVTVPRCGGAYGMKITRANHSGAACALVTHLMHRPCRFVMSMQSDFRVTGKRLPCTRDFEVGISSSGEIQYLEYHLYSDNGYVVSDPVSPLQLAPIRNCYDNRRWQYKIFTVLTDTASNTYLRSPGSLETISMTEQIMERISYEIERDPVQVRLNNIEPAYVEVQEMVQTLLRDGEYNKRKEEVQNYNKVNRWKKRGLRVAFMNWPVPILLDYHVLLSVYHADATVVIHHGGIEIGQGINTKVIQAVAYTLKIPIEKVRCKAPTAATNPNNFATGSSRTTQSVCFGAIKCCQILLDRLSAVRDTLNEPTWEVLIEVAFNRGINLQTSYRVTANDQVPYRSGGVALTEVELDILTGEHEILRVDIIEDVGTSINPELDIGQIEGAFMMGVGYWTHEELIYDEKTGELLTDRSWYYKVPLTKDIPIDFRIQLRRNSYNPIGTLGARAVAEPPTCLSISVAFALREAIVSSRENTGYPRNKWFRVDGPFTLAANVLSADAKLEEFLFY
ncbi:probable aldehyde oxidase gad-3 [Spodoptera litura]|uniref:Probable aldehyde oxidase gad-3 n=1 Tax=Spodoptera litura TaxID=69820 RepID=A0A9J7EGA3_SPOLT|nr:probable aldehyde oxidase gad-3 [Spodoptera litura]